jgi:hypothetical protein
MRKKYDPNFLLLCVATYFESEGKMRWVVDNDVFAKYEIVIEIKDSVDKFRIEMHGKKLLLMRGLVIKNHDELEKNKDHLGFVIINRVQKTSIEYPNFEDFYNKVIKD